MKSSQMLGRCLYFDWVDLDYELNEWARHYFDEDVICYTERDDREMCLVLERLDPIYYKKLERLLSLPEYEEEHILGYYIYDYGKVALPHEVATEIVSRMLGSSRFSYSIATECGVYLMKNKPV